MPTPNTLMNLRSTIAMASLLAISTAIPAHSQEATANIVITESGFQPNTLTVRSGTKIALLVSNRTTKTAEFESVELNREKVIPAGSSVTIYIGPLSPGSYPFFDDFNQKARGQIIAK